MGLGGLDQVTGAAEKAGHLGGDLVEELAGGGPGGQLGSRLEVGSVQLHRLRIEVGAPPSRELGIAAEGYFPARGPLAVGLPAPRHCCPEELIHLAGYVERPVGGPPYPLLGEANLLLPEGTAMGFRGVLSGGSSVGDVGAADHQRRPARRGQRLRGRLLYGPPVVAVHGDRVPAHRLKAGRYVLREGEVGGAVDGDVVVVVEVGEPLQPQVARQRSGLG